MDLVLRGDARDDADVVDPLVGLVVAPRRELGAGDRAALEPELAGDRLGGDRVVAGDHPHLDAGSLCPRDRVACLGARRIDDPDEGQQVQVLHLEEQVGVRVERGGIEVALRGRQDPQALLAQPIVLGQVLRAAVLADRDDLAVRPPGRRRREPAAGRERPSRSRG